jgi:hypothetical protein
MVTNRTALVGGALVVLATAGYVAGVVAPYPGRAFSVTGLMVGVTLLAVAGGGDDGRDGDGDGDGDGNGGGDGDGDGRHA